MRAGIYTRLSHDPEGTSTATQRQQQDCRALVESRGWEVAATYEDADISAYSGKRRPAWEQMLTDVAERRVDVVVVWRSDRLARQPRDLERFLDAADRAGVRLVSVTEPFDVDSHAGTLMLRMVVSFAHHESAVKAERVARAKRESAEGGRWPGGGRRLLGYSPTGEVLEDEARLVREAYGRVLQGDRPWRIAADWNERGITTPAGAAWTHRNLGKTLTAARYAGLRVYQGEVVGQGEWQAIVTEAQWHGVQAALRPARSQRRGPRRWLLTGLLVCGRCGAYLAAKSQPSRPRAYGCRTKQEGGCGGIQVAAEPVEVFVAGMVFAALASPMLGRLVQASSTVDTEDLLADLRLDEQTIEDLTRDHYVNRLIPKAAFLQAKDEVEARMAETRRALAQRTSTVLLDLPSPEEMAGEWDRRGMPWQRALLEACLEEVIVNPAVAAGRGAMARLPDRLDMRWKA